MNRVGVGLAVGAGYLLGRTKKLKLAVAVGTMVAGKKLNLTPQGIAELVKSQMQNNPQFKEVGDQLRTDLQGVGKAASGALVERQIGALADRLHGRTAQVRDQLSGVASKAPGVGADDADDADDSSRASEASEDSEPYEEYEEHEDEDEEQGEPEERSERAPEKAPPQARKAAKKAPAKKAAAKAPAKKAAAKRAQPARKAAGKKTAGARSAARGATGNRQSKGGGER
ncbi:DNA primase [Streptomyces sp. AC602_WCS936]|uniref:DNA primase n=1 Tax=Streptomyces sp. AC602_WCS936 TaxID=2823685 RepID=UPI001C26C2E5|nr:DNA primase [Streptomyces sp. AC602_WCS936]